MHGTPSAVSIHRSCTPLSQPRAILSPDMYKRVLLKLSGEALAAGAGFGIDANLRYSPGEPAERSNGLSSMAWPDSGGAGPADIQKFDEVLTKTPVANAPGSSKNHGPAPLLDTMRDRLAFLLAVELGYLTLQHSADSLSTGEARRIRLTTALGSNLVNALLCLDQPTAGLHPRDTGRLLAELLKLRSSAGNALVAVEHDADVLAMADHVIDLGPGAGEEGGRVLYRGPGKAAAKKPKIPLRRTISRAGLPWKCPGTADRKTTASFSSAARRAIICGTSPLSFH